MYDIVIIGAGPAGSTLARQVSKSKKKILIIDAENEKIKTLWRFTCTRCSKRICSL